MAIDTSTLPTRTPSELRAFVNGQRLRVSRTPDDVSEPNPPDDYGDDYWRYLTRRVALEGTCLLYQTYDGGGDENDWNLDIAPDAAHAWLLDPALLWALSTASGAPSSLNYQKVKRYHGVPVIECELTPDDGLHGRFTNDGLPIDGGSLFADGGEKQGQGPTCANVGVYGVFCGDFGHDGRPEIHPFDAFWRRYSLGTSSTINWDLGVFQDDSNRFNDDWSKPPIDIEFRIPFCVDFPVTVAGTSSVEAVFTIRKSPRCGVITKNVVSTGVASVERTFTGRTVRLMPTAENALTIIVKDGTGLPKSQFSLDVTDVHVTSVRTLGRWWLRSRWLSGYLDLRVSVGQDGFAYWSFDGPNSASAATAADDLDGVVAPTVSDRMAMVASPRRRNERGLESELHLADARLAPREQFSAIVVHQGADGRQVEATVEPRQEAVVDVDGSRVFLGAFDFFARARRGPRDAEGRSTRGALADLTPAICRLAGSTLVHRLRATPADLEIDEEVQFSVVARFAPFRNGVLFGEERSALSDILTAKSLESFDAQLTITVESFDGDSRVAVLNEDDVAALTNIEPPSRRSRHGVARLVRLGPFNGQPVSLVVTGMAIGTSGLKSEFRTEMSNVRVHNPADWLAEAMGTSFDDWRRTADRLAVDADRLPTDVNLSRRGIADAATSALAQVAAESSSPFEQVAGVAALLTRAEDLLVSLSGGSVD